MGETYKYVLELVDKLSAPARAAKKQVDSLGKSIDTGAKDLMAFGQALGAVVPYALAAAAALGVVVALLLGGGKLALGAAQFKSNTISALASVEGVGPRARVVFEEIRRLSDELGIAEVKAQALGLALLDAGVAQSDLAASIRAIAILEKVRGAEAAKKLEEVIKKSAAAGQFKLEGESLVGTGLSKGDVLGALATNLGKSTEEIEAAMKAGTIAAKDGVKAINDALAAKKLVTPMMKLEDVGTKALEKITRLFEDVNVGPFLDGLKDLLGLFDSSTVSGQAFKYMVTTIFSELFAWATKALPYAKFLFLELIIVALKIYISLKPVVDILKKVWATATEGNDLINVLRYVALVVGIVIGLFVGLFLLFAIQIAIAVTLWGRFIGAIEQVKNAIGDFVTNAWARLTSLFNVETATGLANALIDGLVGGITGGAARVVGSLQGVAQGAIGAVKGVLGIASPSKVMEQMGAHTAEGFAQGVEAGAPDAQSALSATVAPPTASPAGGKGGGVTITLGSIVVHIGGAGGGGDVKEDVKRGVLDAFEQLALQLGGAAAPAGSGA